MVFEDKNSGEEMVRTHMGRTWRVYNEPAQTESNFVAGGDETASGIAACNTRLLNAEDFDSTLSEPRNTNLKQNGKHHKLRSRIVKKASLGRSRIIGEPT